MNVLRLLIAAPLMCLAMVVNADWVESTGTASTKGVSYAEAREAARQDAIRQAMLEFGVRVTSHQRLQNGVLVHDELDTTSQVKIRREKIREEILDDDLLTLRLAVDLERLPQCPTSDADKYKKSLALLGFSLQTPVQASIGGLNNVEAGLTQALAETLAAHESMLIYAQGRESGFADVMNAPSYLDGQRMLSQAMQYAKQLNVQFVVSGVIRDMGLVNPKAYSTSVWRKTIKFFAQANERRRFSLDLFVHDGLSGELVWQSNFATEGNWNKSMDQVVGFGSQEFWNTPYGGAVAELLDQMAYSLDQQLRCQPFMTRIARVDGKTLHFSAGAKTGIRPGDRFSVYRSFSYHDADQRRGIELTNTKSVLTVSQVHPNFASGTVPTDPHRMNIQQDDVLIVW